MTRVARLDELEPGSARRFDVNGVAVAVVRIDDEVFAIADTCSHANVSLSDGVVWCDEKQLECPRHGSAFGLVDGRPNTLPATQPVKVYEARVANGDLHVEVS